MYKQPAPLAICATLLIAVLWFAPGTLSSQTSDVNATTSASIAPPYGNCPALGHAGVDICDLGSGSFIPSPFQLIASGTGAKGPVRLMELWADGKKLCQTSGNLFDEPVSLSSGVHQLTLVELDTTGNYVKSAPLSVNVNEGGGETKCLLVEPPNPTCSQLAAPGVNLCEPIPNTCSANGFTTVIATGTGASGKVARMELWVDGVKIANFTGNTINTNIQAGDFSQLTVVEVDSKGSYIKSQVVTLHLC